MRAMNNPYLKNPQLEGEPFFWEGGPTGVFLSHGLTATAAEVRPMAQRLQAQGYTVAGPLLPGHGTRPEDLNRVRWQEWAQAGEEVYQQLKQRCERVFLGGESAGAVLALYLASEHPEAVAVLTYAPAIKLALRPLDLIRLRLLAPFVASVPKGAIDREDNWQGYKVNPLKGAVQLLKFDEEVIRRLPRIHQPVLIVQGRLDTTVHLTVGEIILGGVSSTVKELHWMEHSTHVVLLDQELDEVMRITLEFMQKV
jgi:carboxylesterase